MIRFTSILRIFLTLLVLGLIILPHKASSQFFFLMENEIIGEKAPNFTLPDLNGKKVEFAQVSKDKNTILFFWATWCPNCRHEIIDLGKEKKNIDKSGVELILIDLGESSKVVKDYMKHYKVNLPMLLDETEEVSELYEVYGLPTYIFVNKKGIIKEVMFSLPQDYLTIFDESET